MSRRGECQHELLSDSRPFVLSLFEFFCTQRMVPGSTVCEVKIQQLRNESRYLMIVVAGYDLHVARSSISLNAVSKCDPSMRFAGSQPTGGN